MEYIIAFLLTMYLANGCFKLGQKFHSVKNVGFVPWREFFRIVYGWMFIKRINRSSSREDLLRELMSGMAPEEIVDDLYKVEEKEESHNYGNMS